VTYLLDTHAFIWFDAEPQKLSPRAAEILTSPATVLLSVVSVWEMAVKIQLGKLKLRAELGRIVAEQIGSNRVQLLDVNLAPSLALLSLPEIHRDPFDRLLIAQAMVERLVLLTVDSEIRKYPIPTEW